MMLCGVFPTLFREIERVLLVWFGITICCDCHRTSRLATTEKPSIFFKVAQWTLSYISVSFVEASVRSMSSKSSYFYRLNAYAYRNVHLSSQVECEVMCFLNTAYSWIWMLAIICWSPYPVSVATKRHNPPRESSMKSNGQTKHKETFLHIQNHQ